MRCVGEFHELTRDDERHLLADVHRVIAHALDLARDDMHANAPFEEGLVGGGVENPGEHAPVEPVDGVVHAGEAVAEFQVPPLESIHGRGEHLQGHPSHLLQPVEHDGVRRQSRGGIDDLGDVDRDVGDPLEVEVGVQERRQQP